jgi:TolB-like protein/Tfp pilus assembly protein PilF
MVLPRFLAELKHRKVYRAAVVYAAVGWALLEAADVVLPRLGLPDWTVDVVLAVVLLCFPLAIVFAWIFDISAQGIVRTGPLSPASHPHRLNIPAIVEFVLILVLVLAVGSLYVERLSLEKRLAEAESSVRERPGTDQLVINNPEQYRAIAVLPFADMSEAGDQAWFAEGIAEELLLALAGVEGLHVMARTSSFAFKETDKTVAEIAEILGVQAVLEGSVRRSGERVRIAAQLVDADSGYHLWSGSYERRLTDIFQLQDELARAVVQALRIELGVGSSGVLIAEQTRSQEAYNWFIRARAVLDLSNPETTARGIALLERAVEADPDYALAWGYLSWARSLNLIWHPFEQSSPAVVEAYERALALNPDQSDAQAARALMTLLIEHDWEAAGKMFQHALRSPDNASAITGYSMFFLQHIDKVELALQLQRKAEQRDPLHADYKAQLSHLLLNNGDAEAAVLKAREALALKERHIIALWMLMSAETALGNFAAVEELVDRLPPELQQWPNIKVRRGINYAAAGEVDKAREIYREHLANPWGGGMVILAQLALLLGEVEEAIDIMEREVARTSWTQAWARTLYRNHPALKDHPRYLLLLERIGLDDESVAALHHKLPFDQVMEKLNKNVQ